jgi:UDP-N-acetylmuramate--alanine ligase
MRYHAQDYAEAFNGADQVVITEMYAANETSISGIDTPWFVAQLRQANNLVHYVHDQNQITDFLEKRVQAQDMVFFFGGDDFFQMADAWADRRQKN